MVISTQSTIKICSWKIIIYFVLVVFVIETLMAFEMTGITTVLECVSLSKQPFEGKKGLKQDSHLVLKYIQKGCLKVSYTNYRIFI